MTIVASCDEPVPGTWTSGGAVGAREVGGVSFFMADFAFTTPMYLVGAPKYVFYNSNTYQPFPFGVEPMKNQIGPAPVDMRMSASNVDRSIATAILSEVVQGKEVVIRKAYWHATDPTTHTDPYVYFRGQIDAVTISEQENSASVAFTIKNDFVRWDKPIPSNQFSITCNWTFKSNTPGCQYTGAASLCDRSYERCVVLGNTDRFRGFRHMAIMEDHEIWWGRQKASSE